jgi:hypothetical protein
MPGTVLPSGLSLRGAKRRSSASAGLRSLLGAVKEVGKKVVFEDRHEGFLRVFCSCLHGGISREAYSFENN